MGEPASPPEDGKDSEKTWNNTQTVLLGWGFFFPSNCSCYFNRDRHFLDDFQGL